MKRLTISWNTIFHNVAATQLKIQQILENKIVIIIETIIMLRILNIYFSSKKILEKNLTK